jgi:hypothetical protein
MVHVESKKRLNPAEDTKGNSPDKSSLQPGSNQAIKQKEPPAVVPPPSNRRYAHELFTLHVIITT